MKKRWRVAVLFFLSALGVCAVGFLILVFVFLNAMSGYSPGGPSIRPGETISRAGNYRLDSGEHIDVRIDEGIVRFDFKAADGRTVVHSDVRPSDFHRWMLHLDSQKWIWLYSGDIGTYVWTTYTTGSQQSTRVNGDKELEAQAPPGFVRP